MQAIEGNRAVSHIAPVQCLTPADAAAAALSVRERRRSLFYAVEPARKPEIPRPIKPKKVEVVPTPTDFLGLWAVLTAYAETAKVQLATTVTLSSVVTTVSKVMEISRSDLISHRRTKGIVIPRHIAIALCKKLTRRSLPEIGQAFGGMDHTSILYAVRKLAPVMAEIEDALHAAPLPYVVAIAAAAYARVNPSAPVRL
jgi:hypothetical protein